MPIGDTLPYSLPAFIAMQPLSRLNSAALWYQHFDQALKALHLAALPLPGELIEQCPGRYCCGSAHPGAPMAASWRAGRAAGRARPAPHAAAAPMLPADAAKPLLRSACKYFSGNRQGACNVIPRVPQSSNQTMDGKIEGTRQCWALQPCLK